MQLTKSNKKIVAVIVVVIVIAGGIVFLLSYRHNGVDLKEVDTPLTSEDRRKLSATNKKPQPVEKLPVGTISPSELTKNIKQYAGKTVSVRGLFIKLDSGQYLLVDQDTAKRVSILLQSENNVINFDQYLPKDTGHGGTLPSGADVQIVSQKPYTVTGSYGAGTPNASNSNSGTFTVSSVQL